MVFASSDRLYKSAVFGRDSLEVAEDIMPFKPGLAGNILLTLARLQGLVVGADNEEAPGKIVHEFRATVMDGKAIDNVALDIFNHLSYKWGGNDTEMAYYGSIDATPHFLRTLHMYCQMHGDRILDKTITLHKTHDTITMRQAASRAMDWLMRELSTSRSGLLEYKRRNPRGILNQVWKDSDEFYVHENGQTANHNEPIASIEVQGLAYDGLIAARDFGLDQAEACEKLAEELRNRTFDLLWQPARHYFALGTDFSEEGDLRIITTATANPAALLDTSIFDTLPDDKRQEYITGIVKKIFGKDFLTSVGIRSRSLAEAHLVPFWDYHGSFVSWPKETYDIAKGLKRQGMPTLAGQLENRLLNVVGRTRQYAEFFYIDEHGRILTHAPETHNHGELMVIDSTNKPETIQAWTVSAIYAITTTRIDQSLRLRKKRVIEGWQTALNKSIYARIPHVERHFNPLTLWAQYPTYKYTLKAPPPP
jgi:glycogen debranching enzyme